MKWTNEPSMPLHDILPPIQMNDYTFIYMVVFILLVLFIFVFKFIYKKQKKDAKYYISILDHCDFKDAKKTAFQFSYYGKQIFIDKVTKTKFSELQQTLKQYKYNQNSGTMPKHLEYKIKQLLEEARKYHV